MTLETDVTPGISLRGNRELIGQALVNLLENALKYSSRPTGKIVHQRQCDEAAAASGSRSPTTGRAFREADRERVVERFVRLEKSRTEPGRGWDCRWSRRWRGCTAATFRIEDNARACGR